MQQERFYIIIGFFVFGALLLAITSFAFLYNNYMHGKIETYVMLFQGSLNGLNRTSPINYRGVKVGEVKRIELTANKARTNVAIPVYVEFFVGKSFVQQDDPISILIGNGVVATIASPNLLTGTASIELVTGKRTKPRKYTTYRGYKRFPTAKVDEDSAEYDTLKIVRRTFEDISRFVRSKEFNHTFVSVTNMADNVDKLALRLDKQVPAVLSDFREMARGVDKLTDRLNIQLPQTLHHFDEMAGGVDKLTDRLDKQIPQTLLHFNESLDELNKAAYSARNLADYLSRHPESLLRGKP